MWTSTLELSTRRVILTQVLGKIWNGAYFSSFAPLQVQNLPRQPLPAANWVRVRNSLAGICGSDLHMIYVDGDFRIAPAALPEHTRSYPGHEVVGEIIEVGDEVLHLQVGDRVVLQSGLNCITSGNQPLCRSCATGNYALCERTSLLPGPEPIGGGWSEEMLVHEQQLFRISPDMNDEQAVLLEPAAVALHAVLRRLPRPGENVLIIGAGTIGLLTLQVIHALVPDAIVSVMARYPFQIEQATRMGASHIIYSQDSYQEVESITGAKLFTGRFDNKMLLGGFEVIFDTIGTRKTLHDSLRWARAGGGIVLVGVSLHTMQLDLTPIWYQEIDLIGTLAHGMETWPIGSFERHSTFSIAAQLIENELLYPEKLITHHFALTNYRSAFTAATAKSHSRAIKVVFDYSLLPATVVPNVRASARKLHPVTTGAVWPQEQQSTHEETNLATSAEAYSVQPEPPSTQEPLGTPDPLTQSPRAEIVEIEETEHIPAISNTSESAIEEQAPTTSHVDSKPRRSRSSTKSQRHTENTQTTTEDIENTTATNTVPETLEE